MILTLLLAAIYAFPTQRERQEVPKITFPSNNGTLPFSTGLEVSSISEHSPNDDSRSIPSLDTDPLIKPSPAAQPSMDANIWSEIEDDDDWMDNLDWIHVYWPADTNRERITSDQLIPLQ